jgi:hypothetical protein
MTDISEKFVVVTLTQSEAKVWATGVGKGSHPEVIDKPAMAEHHHSRTNVKPVASAKEDPATVAYFNSICRAIEPASEILLIGHGVGKSSAMLHFIQFAERKHPDLAKKVADAVDLDVTALTEPEILAAARSWFKSHHDGYTAG